MFEPDCKIPLWKFQLSDGEIDFMVNYVPPELLGEYVDLNSGVEIKHIRAHAIEKRRNFFESEKQGYVITEIGITHEINSMFDTNSESIGTIISYIYNTFGIMPIRMDDYYWLIFNDLKNSDKHDDRIFRIRIDKIKLLTDERGTPWCTYIFLYAT